MAEGGSAQFAFLLFQSAVAEFNYPGSNQHGPVPGYAACSASTGAEPMNLHFGCTARDSEITEFTFTQTLPCLSQQEQ